MDISSLQFPTSTDMPKFSYGSGINGDPAKASQSYGQCLLAGGNSVDCGASAWQAGVTNAKITSTDNSTGDDCKGKWNETFCYMMKGWNSKDPAVLQAAKEEDAKSWLSNPTRIIVVVLGVVLVGSALFMFGISSFNPVSIAMDKVGAIND